MPAPAGHTLRISSRPDWQIISDVANFMGKVDYFRFSCPADIWEEIRRVWPAGAGITYQRIEQRGLQWPCLDTDDPGTTVLHRNAFSHGKRASLFCSTFAQSQ